MYGAYKGSSALSRQTSYAQGARKLKPLLEYRRPSRRGGSDGKRELVVAAMHRESGGYRRKQTVLPFIRMSGLWLRQLGFDRGDRIEVTAERERLVLTVVGND